MEFTQPDIKEGEFPPDRLPLSDSLAWSHVADFLSCITDQLATQGGD